MQRSDGGANIKTKHLNIQDGASMAAANITKYRTTKDIVVPKGTHVVFVNHMRQDVVRAASAVVGVGKDMHYDWLMYFDDALESGLIEKVPD
jgi:hypothetical protein